MIELRTEKEIEEMKPAGAFVANVLQTCNEFVKPGVNLLEIDELVKAMIMKSNAESCYVDYAPDFGRGPFAHYICTSVNDAVLHGRPFDYTLKAGDYLSLDLACKVNGWAADSAITVKVGEKFDPKTATKNDDQLLATCYEALQVGIKNARSGKRIGDLSWEIGEFCWNKGYEMNVEYGGHGIGREMHMPPHVPNDGHQGRGYKMRPGLVIAIEPYICETTDEIYTDEEDGWTIKSVDGSNGVHFEHTVAITNEEPIILTAWE